MQTMLLTLNKHINNSDFDSIDYSVGGGKNQSFNPLNELFCGIKIVYSPIENIYLSNLNENIEQEIDIKHILKELLGKTKANIRFIFNHLGLPKIKTKSNHLEINILQLKIILIKLLTIIKC